ncbi:MAG: hypothetical protein P8L20_10830 [Flavobacteriales bacterium]|nr:hypothetical protein [Flavobacteriales bacterium]
MKNKALKIGVLYVLISVSVSLLFYLFMYSTELKSEKITLSGKLFLSFCSGLISGWWITAPICRIKFGEVPFLRSFAAFPAIIPITLLLINVPAGSLGLLIFPLAFLQFTFMMSYLCWLHGLEFFALFKRSTYSNLFRERKNK